ncbi:hypothetical protein [Variovorax paradoxus]|uniref:hypothetical protein n=1 Tax=Variovorax paradoxus TaxID=34073 RepID=UPI001ABD4584
MAVAGVPIAQTAASPAQGASNAGQGAGSLAAPSSPTGLTISQSGVAAAGVSMAQTAPSPAQGASIAVQGAGSPSAPPSSPTGPTNSQTSMATVGAPLGFYVPQPKDTLTATGLLLAFLIGFYTLIGRDRKSPYLTNRLFQILLFCVPAVILSLFAQMLEASQGWIELIAKGFGLLALICLIAALVLTLWRVYKIYMRFALFVDSAHPKHLSWYRFIKHFFRRGSDNKPWEWAGIPLSKDLRLEIKKIFGVDEASAEVSTELPTSAAISVARHGQANLVLAELATAFLQEKKPVQYMTASRHPLEFIKYLHDHIKSKTQIEWQEIQSKIVVADAYTRHFGYADSIYRQATSALKRDFGVQHVTAGESFAGLHTASSEAFNKIKGQAQKGKGREPMLVIYEDCYALADLESREQYRVFVRHVVPSERMWQAMFTVFIETAQEKSDWELLASYCDLTQVVGKVEKSK